MKAELTCAYVGKEDALPGSGHAEARSVMSRRGATCLVGMA